MIETAKLLQNILTEAGFKTYAAGGFVRDHLLGREAKDIDLATEALPEQVRDVLIAKDIRVEDTGLQHGTVSAIIDKVPYEITTLRVDKKCDGREAEVVFIKSFEEDSKRRDFTINAMFMDLETGEIFDYHGGREDLKKETLRFVGYAQDRIQEDYLRILRLFRFSSQLGFQIEPEAAREAIKHLPYMISFISTERIYTEMSKLILGKSVFHILRAYKDLVFQVIPELFLTFDFKQRSPEHKWDVYTYTLYGVDFLKKYQDSTLSFAHLFHGIAKPFNHTCRWEDLDFLDMFENHEENSAKVSQRICHRLKFSSDDSKRINFLILNQNRLKEALGKKDIRILIQDCALVGNKYWIWDLLKQREATLAGQVNQDPLRIKLLTKLINEELELFSKGKLESPLSGKELMSGLNLSSGPNLGKVKSHLQKLVVEGDLDPSDTEAAWSSAKTFISENSLS